MISPTRSNPYVPCGENARWVMSQYGHLPVVDEELNLTTMRIWLISITIIIGVVHILILIALWRRYKYERTSSFQTVKKEELVYSPFILMMVNAVGRYVHFIDNHCRPASYHDGDLIYCGILISDTDAFIPFQLIQVSIGIYAANAWFRDRFVSRWTYIALIAWSLLASVGYLHFLVEPITWFGAAEICSILGETLPANYLMIVAYSEYQQYLSQIQQQQPNTRNDSNIAAVAEFEDADGLEMCPLVQQDGDAVSSQTGSATTVRRRSKQNDDSTQ